MLRHRAPGRCSAAVNGLSDSSRKRDVAAGRQPGWRPSRDVNLAVPAATSSAAVDWPAVRGETQPESAVECSPLRLLALDAAGATWASTGSSSGS